MYLLTNVTISDNVTEIGDHAFGFTDDDEGNFHKIDGFTIKANFDSQAKKYAKENKISIEYLDGNKDMPYIHSSYRSRRCGSGSLLLC
mgnify:CR=1 FL=1